jgi:hypothetical protein
MRLVVSDPAADLIEKRGGHLYVWPKKGRCCGAVTTLATSTELPGSRDFRRVAATKQFELFLPARLARLPDELQLEVRRFPRRVEAYWDGCAWVT